MFMKKKIIFVMLILACFASNAFSQNEDKQEQWNLAIKYMEQQRYKSAIKIFESLLDDKDFEGDCLVQIEKAKKKIAHLTISTQKGEDICDEPLKVPYSGIDTMLKIKSNYKWQVDSLSDGITIERRGGDLRIQIQKENKELQERMECITISAGEAPNKIKHKITILQEAHPPYLDCSSKNLTFSAVDELQNSIAVFTNTEWLVKSNDAWCYVSCDSNKIKISVKENSSLENRKTEVVVNSVQNPNLSIIVNVNQAAGKIDLEASKHDLSVQDYESVEYVRILSNSSWSITDYPNWVVAERVGSSDSIKIHFLENTSERVRESNVNIKAGDKVISIHLKQEATTFVPKHNLKVLDGRNVSIGFTAGYIQPFIASSSSGSYTGSVINYSLGNSNENVNYSSQMGYSVGLVLDFRAYRNWYIKTGLEYMHVQYENSFAGDIDRSVNHSFNIVYKGTFQNRFSELYKFNFINIPILASYRFAYKNRKNLQIDFGPVVNIALSGKMTFEGNSNSDDVYPYTVIYDKTEPIPGNRSSVYMRYTGEMDLFDTKVTNTTTSSTGGMSKDFLNEYSADAAPYKRINLGLRLGVTYEFTGIQVGLAYNYMITNMANKSFWNSRRLPIFGQTSDVLMAGYKHRINTLEIKLGYILRY